jgi:hypothetical protein
MSMIYKFITIICIFILNIIVKKFTGGFLFNIGFKTQNIKERKKYYLLAANYYSIDAMFSLGLYYKDKKKYKKMKNYYLLAINKGCIKSMNNLATYYYKKKI